MGDKPTHALPDKMTSFTKAIAEAKEWKLKAYVSQNQLQVTNKSGRIVGKINADKTVAYRAAGYAELDDIAALVGVVDAPATQNTNLGYAAYAPKNFINVRAGYEFDGIENN